jgi:hypothetical protein
MLVDIAISGDKNLIKKEIDKILKYADFTIGKQYMCNVKTEVIPIIKGASRTISK